MKKMSDNFRGDSFFDSHCRCRAYETSGRVSL